MSGRRCYGSGDSRSVKTAQNAFRQAYGVMPEHVRGVGPNVRDKWHNSKGHKS